MMCKDKYSLRAMTLPEVLVIMIVSAVVFMGVMDGLGLFRRYTHDVAERLTDNIQFYDGYYRLQDIIATSDSLTGNESRISCWRNGAGNITLMHEDSTLIANYGPVGDTLLRRVGEIRTYRENERSEALDSLVVAIESGEGRMEIPFILNVPVQIRAWLTITQMEKDYEYD